MPILLSLFISQSQAAPPKPGVGLVTHQLSATAPLTGDAVWKGLVAGESALLACVGDPAAPVPPVIRALDLTWTVSPGGKASGLSVAGLEPAGPGLGPCLEAAIAGVTWADPGAAPATLTARLVLLHDAYATLTRAPAAMLPAPAPGDRLNLPVDAQDALAPALPEADVEAAVVRGGLDPAEVTKAAKALHAELLGCYQLQATDQPLTLHLLGTYRRDGAVKSIRPSGGQADPVAVCSQAVLSKLPLQQAGVVDWTVRFGAAGLPTNPSSVGAPIILGSLDKALIDEVLKAHMREIHACYQQGLQADPSLAGSMVIKFTIDPKGNVSKAELKSSTLASPSVGDCAIQEFRRMQFPAPKGGGIVIASYPFDFQPG